MKRTMRQFTALLSVVTVLAFATTLPTAAKRTEPRQPARAAGALNDQSFPPPVMNITAVPETTVLASWTFDGAGCDAQGWTAVDFTAQRGDYTHVDDFAGLGGGDFGKLYPLQGAQSIWCGARPDPNDWELCGYVALPGYGNSWDQGFCTAQCLDVTGDVRFDYLIAYYSEPGYDQIDIEYDHCDENWVSVRNFSGEQAPVQLSDVAPDSVHDGSLRWRVSFRSDGAWSDEDGLWDTDGAFILDSLTVTDAGGTLLATELMEVESVGDQTTASGNWTSCPAPGYGDFSGLFRGIDVLQEDPCVSNLSCLWGFFNGSTYNYACAGYPEQKVVPYGNSDDQYINNHVISPVVPITGTGSVIEYNFDVYFDMPLNAVVFYMWFVRGIVDGCPAGWRDRASVGGFGDSKTWRRISQRVDDLIPNAATDMQVALGVVDMCPFWCGTYGTGDCHSHSPLFDNVEIIRIEHRGPIYSVRDIDLFQDSFAADGTTTGTVRADMALDILPSSSANVRPGDSTVVRTWYPEGDLAGDPHTGFGPAVYGYVNVRPPQAGKSGAALTQDTFRWPVVDSLTSGGDTWYCVRMDSVFNSAKRGPGWYPDAFCLDLNDNLFTPGDTIRFFFASTCGPPANATHYYSEFTGITDDLAMALNSPMEMTCLPTAGADILYVDDFDRPFETYYPKVPWESSADVGAEPFFQTAFQMLAIDDRVDRFDVRDPWRATDVASRVTNVSQQLTSPYRTIIWNTGDLTEDLIGDGPNGNGVKSDEFAMLHDYLDNLTVPGGIYLSGDNLAFEWGDIGSASGAALRAQYIGFGVTSADHNAYGLALSPLVVGEAGGCLDGDNFLAYGGCPHIGTFDVLTATGTATVEASYTSAGSGDGAVIAQATTNGQGQDVGVVLSGFSYHHIRDLDENAIPARVEHLRRILEWLGNTLPQPTPTGPTPWAYALGQNYPNPFNPTTAIEFSVRERVPVTLRVYNVRGQLVKTLVDDTRVPGIVHRIEWDGRNDAGQSVASGVYFYQLATKGYSKTRKMVLLK